MKDGLLLACLVNYLYCYKFYISYCIPYIYTIFLRFRFSMFFLMFYTYFIKRNIACILRFFCLPCNILDFFIFIRSCCIYFFYRFLYNFFSEYSAFLVSSDAIFSVTFPLSALKPYFSKVCSVFCIILFSICFPVLSQKSRYVRNFRVLSVFLCNS